MGYNINIFCIHTSRLWSEHEEIGASSSSTFAKNSHGIGITTKVFDKLIHPSQSFDLVKYARVARYFFRVERKETSNQKIVFLYKLVKIMFILYTKRPKTVLNLNQDDII